MAKKITSQDLFEGDIFATVRESVEQTIGKIQTLNSELTESAKLMKGSASGIKTDSAKGQKDFNKFTQEANQLKREKIELEKQEAQLQALLNKAKQEELKAAKAANAEAERQAKAQEKAVKQAQAESSAYAQKSKQLNELRKAWKDLAIQNKENTADAQKLLTEIQDLDAELKAVDATVGQHQRNVGNYGEATQNLKKELRELTKALQTMESTDPRFQEMAIKAGELKDQIADTQAIVKSTAGTAVENLGTGLAKAGKVGIDAFAGMTGAMGLFGIQSEGAMQTMAKLQELAAMSEALNSLGALGDTMKEIQASFTAAAVKLGLFTTAKEVDTVVTEGQTVATVGATTATNVLGKAMKALPIVAIIAGIAGLVYAVTEYFSANNKVAESLKKTREEERKKNEEIKKGNEFVAKESAQYVGLIVQLKATNAGSKERSQLIKQINSQYGTTLKNLSDETAFQAQLNNAVKDYIRFQRAKYEMAKNEERITEILQKQEAIELKLASAQMKRHNAQFMGGPGSYQDESTIRQKANDDIIRYTSTIKYLDKQLEMLGYNQLTLTEQTENKYIPAVQKSTNSVNEETNARKENEQVLTSTAKLLEREAELRESLFDPEALKESLLMDEKRAVLGTEIAQTEAEIALAKAQQSGDIKAITKAEEDLRKAKEAQIRAQLQLDLAQTDNVNERTKLEKEAELAIVQLGNEKILKSDQQTAEERNKWAETVANYFIEQSNRKIAQIDKEKAAAESQFDYLKQLAAQGNIDAKESLAEQQRIIDEANAKKERELKRQQRIKLAEAIYSTYNSKVAAGSENPLMETMRDAALLQQFIMSLPTFFDGTEDTGINGKGIDGKGGFHAILHPNERVIPKSLNDHIGGMSNEALTKLAMEYQAGKVVRSDSQIGSAYETAILASKIDELNETIRNKPETNIEIGEITQSVMNIVKSSKQGHTTIYNRYRIRS
ncbi:MAG: hypothetical protein ACK47F_01535 [Flavobacteriales bacterium]